MSGKLSFEEQNKLAASLIPVVEKYNDNFREIAETFLRVGEPIDALSYACGIAMNYPELYEEFPQELYDLVKDPYYSVIFHALGEELLKHEPK